MANVNETRARKIANKLLAAMATYHRFIPIADIDAILNQAGLKGMEEGIYCGREGRVNEQVGVNTWLCLSWYKMEVSGDYEITAYVS
jgi:hypothetical protein